MMKPVPIAALLALAAALFFPAALRAADDEPPRKEIIVCGQVLKLMTGDEVRALGFPWTDVPDDENASTWYIQGANALHALPQARIAEEQRDHVIRFVWDDAMKELADRLDAAKPALDSYRKGSTMRACQPPYAKTATLAGMLLPDLSPARNAARYLAAEARRHEANGRFKEAVDNYIAIVRIGSHYGTARTLIDNLVGVACIGIALDGAAKGICREKYPPEELARLIKELDVLRSGLPNYAHAMRCEKAFGLGTIDDIMRAPHTMTEMGMGNMPAPDVTLSPLQLRWFRILFPDRTMKKDMAGFYDRSIEAAAKPIYEKDARRDPMLGGKPWNFFAMLLLPALGRVRSQDELCRAKLDLVRIVAALQIYKAKEGVYPDALKWLVDEKILPDVPLDPMSGKPLLYKVKEGEFTVYSFGENFEDDGGELEPRAGGPPDVGYTSKLPKIEPYKKPEPANE